LSWSGKQGAQSGSQAAAGSDRSLLERLAMDSPEQFILAQLRGDSYYTVARNVRPESAGQSEDYTGPVWDLVRVGESDGQTNGPQSRSRLYYINSGTGLIEKVLSQEAGAVVTAELSQWTNLGGEFVPGHIRWLRKDQVIMEFALSDASFGPRS
jgi:hypothetical protein